MLKIAKLFYFCHLKKLVRPETFGPYYVSVKVLSTSPHYGPFKLKKKKPPLLFDLLSFKSFIKFSCVRYVLHLYHSLVQRPYFPFLNTGLKQWPHKQRQCHSIS